MREYEFDKTVITDDALKSMPGSMAMRLPAELQMERLRLISLKVNEVAAPTLPQMPLLSRLREPRSSFWHSRPRRR